METAGRTSLALVLADAFPNPTVPFVFSSFHFSIRRILSFKFSHKTKSMHFIFIQNVTLLNNYLYLFPPHSYFLH